MTANKKDIDKYDTIYLLIKLMLTITIRLISLRNKKEIINK